MKRRSRGASECWVLKPFDDDVVICRYAAHACFNIDIYWGKTLKYMFVRWKCISVWIYTNRTCKVKFIQSWYLLLCGCKFCSATADRAQQLHLWVVDRASNEVPEDYANISQSRRRPLTRAFSWLKAPTSAFTFKTYNSIQTLCLMLKQALTHGK